MISGARQYSQRDFAISLTKARVALVTNAFKQRWPPHSLSKSMFEALADAFGSIGPASPVLDQRTRVVQTDPFGLVDQTL